jgi:hypothetical protein
MFSADGGHHDEQFGGSLLPSGFKDFPESKRLREWESSRPLPTSAYPSSRDSEALAAVQLDLGGPALVSAAPEPNTPDHWRNRGVDFR